MAYVMVSGRVRVTTVDEDQQEVVVDEPGMGEFFGFASMLEQTPHQTSAFALEDSIMPRGLARRHLNASASASRMAGMDLLTTLGHQFHAAQQLVRLRATRNPNEIIEKQDDQGRADRRCRRQLWRLLDLHHHVCDRADRFTRSSTSSLDKKAWDPYPFILLNLFLSMLAAIQAPVIMMSQNRQDTKDRLRGELDFDVNRRAESEIQGLSRKLNMLDERLDDLTDLLRGKVAPAVDHGPH